MNQRRLEWLTTSLLLIYGLGCLYIVVTMLAGLKVHFILVGACTVAFFLFAVLHACLSLGVRHAAVFLTISWGVSVVFELLGTSRGWIYGHYYYTDRLGPKILGLVPALIPLAWFMMIYASYVMANDLMGHGHRKTPASPLAFIWQVILSSLIMTSWDLLNDPINVAGGHWVWQEKGAYFGIPISNYMGWLLTTLVIYLSYRLYELWRDPLQIRPSTAYFSVLPVLGYGITMVANACTLVIAGQPGPALAGLFAMGAFLAVWMGQRVQNRC